MASTRTIGLIIVRTPDGIVESIAAMPYFQNAVDTVQVLATEAGWTLQHEWETHKEWRTKTGYIIMAQQMGLSGPDLRSMGQLWPSVPSTPESQPPSVSPSGSPSED